MSITVGIDLGTSTSEISYIKEGKPVIIKNELDESITMSVVSVDLDGEIIVGSEAKSRYLLYPKDTIMEVKRLMGSNDKILLKEKEYTPEEISAEILKFLKKSAEAELKEPIGKAVITVPAYFTDSQRKATVKAADLAGLEVKRIINEPTAAALAYGIENMSSEANVLIYDLGGGTFDVTLLEMFDGILEVKASSGNNKLGGKDFDDKIIKYLIENFNKKYEIDLSSDISAMIKIKSEAEKCKIALSNQSSYEIRIPFIAKKNDAPIAMDEKITKEEFEKMISNLIETTSASIDVVIKDSKISKDEIDLILLVGGSTKIPKVKKFIEDYLGQVPKELIDPDLAVSQGAAVQAGILDDLFDIENGILITDVSPYALGVKTAVDIFGHVQDDIMDILIERNTTIPVTVENTYVTMGHNQEIVEIAVYQGDNKIASKNNLIDKFKLTNIPKNRAGEEKINISFSYDANGILNVEGTVVSTGEQVNVLIDMLEIQENKKMNLEDWVNTPRAKEFRAIFRKIDRILTKNENIELLNLAEDLKIALIKEEDILIDDLENEILDFLEVM